MTQTVDMPNMSFDAPYVTTQEQAVAAHRAQLASNRPQIKYKHVAQPKQAALPKYDHAAIVATYTGGKSLDDTAAEHECSVSTVRHSLKKFDIEPRGREQRTNPVDKIINPRRERSVVDIHIVSEPVKPARKEYPNRDELLKLAVSSCKKLCGMAEIGGGYVIVDTSKFEITEKS